MSSNIQQSPRKHASLINRPPQPYVGDLPTQSLPTEPLPPRQRSHSVHTSDDTVFQDKTSLTFSSLHSRKTVSLLFRVAILLALFSTIFLIKNQTHYQGHAATTGLFPNLVDTTNIHAAQIFNYNISNLSTETGNVDYVWGSGSPTQPTGMYNTYYMFFSGDQISAYTGSHDITWWKANHPDWIEYQCDKTTIAYVSGISNVPLDFTNPAVQSYMQQTYIIPATKNGYSGIDFDGIELDNGGSWTGARCGHFDANGNWVQQFSGTTDDPAFRQAVIAWAQSMHSWMHSNVPNATMNINSSYDFRWPTDSVSLLKNTDIDVDEQGWTHGNDGSTTTTDGPVAWYYVDSYWTTKARVIQNLLASGHGWVSINREPVAFSSVTNAEVQWALASYLLTKNNASFISINGSDGYGALDIRPEYTAPIGSPTNSMYQSQGVYMRDFTNGKAIVNPSSTQSFTVTLPSNTYTDLYGNAINSATLDVHSGIVLLGQSNITPTSTITSPTSTSKPTNTPTLSPTPVSAEVLPPTVTILSPLNGDTVRRHSYVTLTAFASDDVGVTKVSYTVNGTPLCTSTNAPYTCSWSVPGKPRATYTITATAYDVAGYTGTNSISVTAN